MSLFFGFDGFSEFVSLVIVHWCLSSVRLRSQGKTSGPTDLVQPAIQPSEAVDQVVIVLAARCRHGCLVFILRLKGGVDPGKKRILRIGERRPVGWCF